MNPLSMAEMNALNWIAESFHNEWMDVIMPFISSLGDKGMIWILVGVMLFLLGKQEKATGAQVLLALLLSLIFCNLILKNAVDRIRPCDLNTAVDLLVSRPKDPSFPSGHTSASFAAATVLMLCHSKLRWPAATLAVLMGFSRLYLYVHFPSDVLVGAGLGIACGVASTRIWKKWLGQRILPPKKTT